jgi:hypothetical protein
MKRIVFLILIMVAFVISPMSGVYSLEYIAGAKAWYANWDPVLKSTGENVPWMGWQYMETGSGWLYGPNVGIILSDKVNLSVSYLYGKMQSQFNADYRATESDGKTSDYSIVGKNDITRQDVDSALSLQLAGWLKIFAGFKYQTVDMTMKQSGAKWYVTGGTGGDSGFEKVKMTFKQKNYAPALGTGFSLPLGSMFALTANLSALYMRGEQKITHRSVIYTAQPVEDFDTPKSYGGFDSTMALEGYGVNIEPAILLLLNDINTIIVLGFRYQYVRYDGTWDTPPQGVDKKFEDMNDTLYGAYLSVLYKF